MKPPFDDGAGRTTRGAVAAAILIFGLVPSLLADFRRGDVNLDGRVNVTDAVASLAKQFGHGGSFPCEDAADADDDGRIALGDAIVILRHLFSGGSLPAPGPAHEGPDPSCDRLSCRDRPDPTPAIVINELLYHPLNAEEEEFIELYNRSRFDVDVGGYSFTQGITLTIPAGTVVPAGAYLLVARNPDLVAWRRNAAPRVGPYEGALSNDGERLRLVAGDCEIEAVRYAESGDWPRSADGSGRTLERIDPRAPAADHHSWRASVARRGTPGVENSTLGTPTHPIVLLLEIDPPAPRSDQAVTVRATLDAPASTMKSVRVRHESVAVSLSVAESAEMALVGEGLGGAVYSAALPPRPSQSLVRMTLEVEFADGAVLPLPHPADLAPFFSYFVYDGEFRAKLPILWLFPSRRSGVIFDSPPTSGAVVLEPDAPYPLIFDGATLRSSRQGMKLTFLRGSEYRDDRTLNIIPEFGGGGTGNLAPHMEHLGFLVFRELGFLAPRAEWFRVVDYASPGAPRSQRLVIQQVGERFLAQHGLDDGGDLYKMVYGSWEKKTNLDGRTTSLDDLLRALQSGTADARRQAVMERLDLDSVRRYSTISVLIANWDGFHNNLYIYNDLKPGSRWRMIPWDLDQVFETGCSALPIDRPRSGAGCNGRDPGLVSRSYHLQPDLDVLYRDELAAEIASGGGFDAEKVRALIDATEALLLEDLGLLEEATGAPRAARRVQIATAYRSFRSYLSTRLQFLEAALGPSE